MKRILLVMIALMLLAPGVVAFKETFQDYSSDYMATYNDVGYNNGIEMFNTTTGSVAYKTISYTTGYGNIICNINPQPTTYFAFDYIPVNFASVGIFLMDSTFTLIQGQGVGAVPTTMWVPSRMEVKITDSIPKYYVNGILVATGATITSNPSYVCVRNTGSSGTSYGYIDNIVYGETDHYVAASIPPNWTLRRDLLNPTANGVYAWNPSTDTWVSKSSYHFYEWASKEYNSTSYLDIKHYMTGTVVNTTTIYYNHDTLDFNVTAFMETSTSVGATLPDGLYSIGFRDSTQMETFTISSTGAVLTLDQTDYAAGSTATATYDISAGYWDMSTYAYRVDFFDIYGNVISTSPVTAQSGTKTYTFKTTDNVGVYYAALIASPLSDGSTDYWFGYDVCELVGYIIFNGYVNDGATGIPIPGAVLNMTQGDLVYYHESSDGSYYSDTAMYSGSDILMNITASGYKQYEYTVSPVGNGDIPLNFTLNTVSPSYNGIGIRGVFRDTTYGRPIQGVSVAIENSTYGESYNVSTNVAGYYQMDADDSIYLIADRLYNVYGTKTGYGRSANYSVITRGVPI